MIRAAKICWKAIRVQGPGAGRDELRELTASERLAALYRFQNGEVSADHCFVSAAGVEVTGPGDVDWDTFPVLAALEAVSRDELRRLRHILRSDPANLVDEEPAPPTSSGTWALPGFGKPATSREA
jgi:hypothetical protein